jgi:outer membrane protein TolC
MMRSAVTASLVAVCALSCRAAEPPVVIYPEPARDVRSGGGRFDPPPTRHPAHARSAAAQASYSYPLERLPSAAGVPEQAPLETLVGYALSNNPEIQSLRYRARSLSARVPQAISFPDPKWMTNVFLEQIQTAAGPQEVAVSLSQTFPWFGKRELRGQVACHEAFAAYAALMAKELEIIEGVKLAYYDLYYVQRAAAEIRRLQPRLEDIIAVSKVRYETNAPGADLGSVLQARVELAQLKTDLISLDRAEIAAKSRLAKLLHMRPGTEFIASSEVERSRVERKVDVLVELAAMYQPELREIHSEIRRDRSATALAKKDYWPDISLGVNWYGIGSEGLSPVADGRDAVAVGIGGNLPVYRARLDAAVREARYREAADRRRYAAARDRIQSEVETLYAIFQEHDRILAVLESEILPQAEQALDLVFEAYRTGSRDFEQLIDVYRTLVRYRLDRYRQIAEREQAAASLERAVGRILDAVSDSPEMNAFTTAAN